MYRKTPRLRYTTGSLTLPVTAVLAALLWLVPPLLQGIVGAPLRLLGYGLVPAALTTYALVEWNNRNALLRVRSRMVGSTYLLLIAACPALHAFQWTLLPMLSLVPAYFALFLTYGDRRAVGATFHAYFFLSLGSLGYTPLLALAPLLLMGQVVQLRSMSGRCLGAALLGLLLPYWLLLGYALLAGDPMAYFLRLAEAWTFASPRPAAAPMWAVGTFGVVALLSIVALGHYLRTAYNDKIRTRMFFYIIIMVQVVLLGACAAQPQSYEALLPLLLTNSAPLLAHHLTLARGRGSEVWFYVCATALLALAILNYTNLWSNWSISW